MTRSSTHHLIRLQARELWRDGRYFWFALFFPYFMMGIFLFIGKVVPKTPGGPDFSQLVVPMALFLAVTSAALTVTAGPIASLRSKGTLRLLGTTPIGAGRFLATHMLVRAALVTVQIAVVLAISVALGSLTAAKLPAILGSALLGSALFGAIGYLIGGRLSSPEVATNVGTMVQLGALFVSGLVFPPQLLPDAVNAAFSYLPTSFFGDLMLHQVSMSGLSAQHPAWLSVGVLVVTTVVVTVIAEKTFRWDDRTD